MAAMRAARAARKLETGVSDSDSEEEDEDEDLIDIVNPYAAMLNPSGFGQSGDEMDEEEGEGVDEGHEYEGAM